MIQKHHFKGVLCFSMFSMNVFSKNFLISISLLALSTTAISCSESSSEDKEVISNESASQATESATEEPEIVVEAVPAPVENNQEDESENPQPPEPPEPVLTPPKQNRAPSISLSGVTCLEEYRQGDSMIQVEITVTDEDDSSAAIDLLAEIGDDSLDLSEWISGGTNLDVPGTAIANLPIPEGTDVYLLLLAHASDPDGEKSEAALVIPNRCSND
jgi:hypothetical protein